MADSENTRIVPEGTTTKRSTARTVIKAEQEAAAIESRATLAERQRLAHDRTLAATARLTAAAAGLEPERMIYVQHQDAVDAAIEDAFVKTQKLVASQAVLGGCDTVTRGPSISGSVENLFGYDAAPEFPRSDWTVCR